MSNGVLSHKWSDKVYNSIKCQLQHWICFLPWRQRLVVIVKYTVEVLNIVWYTKNTKGKWGTKISQIAKNLLWMSSDFFPNRSLRNSCWHSSRAYFYIYCPGIPSSITSKNSSGICFKTPSLNIPWYFSRNSSRKFSRDSSRWLLREFHEFFWTFYRWIFSSYSKALFLDVSEGSFHVIFLKYLERVLQFFQVSL